ncbi:glycosyltransferase [Oerskovia flava]|uniref:glycosyltransferase n=1 Tax=Oerskovia flava TaxID=2986422 RepID=UPI00223F2396|nr:glycosyltransferase [Oerskovia sp. JB1-3-2]
MSAVARAVGVVVPVHDEEELLPRCLTALDVAVRTARAADPGLVVEVVLVLDACTDRSAQIVSDAGFATLPVTVDARTVGVARATGVRAALARLAARGVEPGGVWVASTDADSAVPPHWLTHQLDLAREGADVVVGTVRPDPADLTPRQRAAWAATHTLGVANGHVHGANLGMRADVYLDAGGYPPVPEHEDVELVAATRRRGARLVATDGCWVLTSGRSIGRTPGGYARHLREDLVEERAS